MKIFIFGNYTCIVGCRPGIILRGKLNPQEHVFTISVIINTILVSFVCGEGVAFTSLACNSIFLHSKPIVMITILFLVALGSGLIKEIPDMYTLRKKLKYQCHLARWNSRKKM